MRHYPKIKFEKKQCHKIETQSKVLVIMLWLHGLIMCQKRTAIFFQNYHGQGHDNESSSYQPFPLCSILHFRKNLQILLTGITVLHYMQYNYHSGCQLGHAFESGTTIKMITIVSQLLYTILDLVPCSNHFAGKELK